MGEPCSRCGTVWGGEDRSVARLVGCVQEAPVNPSLRPYLDRGNSGFDWPLP